jgi:hypothetical protein
MLAFGDLSHIGTVRSTSIALAAVYSSRISFVTIPSRLALPRRRASSKSPLQQYAEQYVASTSSSR